jgi:subtilisin family serine protease
MSKREPADGQNRQNGTPVSGAGRSRSPGGTRAGRSSGGAAPIGSRRERYLVASLAGPYTVTAAGTTAGMDLIGQLQADPRCAVDRVISAWAPAGEFGAVAPSFPDIAVVEMEADLASALAATPFVHVEQDLPLGYVAGVSLLDGLTVVDPGLVPLGDEITVSFMVTSSDGTPLPGAEVYLISTTLPARAVSGPDGIAEVSVAEAALNSIRGIYVQPRSDHWSVWLAQPDLSSDVPHGIVCRRLGDTLTGFPGEELDSWARRAMRFDALPPTFRGHGVKVAIVDSGAAADHPDLAGRITAGRDIVGRDAKGWRVDTVGHGSGTAGILGGSDNEIGIVGAVPEAEIHCCKIFPGGRFGDLIEALDYCIAHGIDVVNLSLGSQQSSELVARKIEQARHAGVACIAAAGNSAGPVTFPANLPSVLAVAAIGKIGEYPPESYHATQMFGPPTPEGYFSAKFTSFGPEVDVCAPGVAIVSSVPPGNYAAADGTSFAAPYVTALAALLFAHHPDFRAGYAVRGADRVARLYELIRGSCLPVAFGDPGRSGAGLPDALRALNLVPPVTVTPPAHPELASLWGAMSQAGLVSVPLPLATPEPAATSATGATADGATATATEALAPLRTALRAAGLLSYDDAARS